MYNVYWGDKPNNFGDVLTRDLLSYFNIDFNHTNVHEHGDLFVIGSIARLAPFGAKVVGSGIIRKNENLNSTVRWKSVRGPLTRKRVIECGGECPEIYGDPALLLPMICKPEEKKYKIGLVPHYQDYKRAANLQEKYHLINVINKNPLEVAKEITKCEKIISSSLHGIICAHAFGIPAARVTFSKLYGDGSKFDDYCESVEVGSTISTIDNPKYTVGKIPDLNPLIEILKSL